MAADEPSTPEALEAIKAAYEQARATLEAGQMQADAARYAADVAAVVARSVGHDTVIVTGIAAVAVIVAAAIQAWSIRDQSAKQARSLAEQSLHQERMAREKEIRDQERLAKTAVSVLTAELAGHLKHMKRLYAPLIRCQAKDRDQCISKYNCKIAAVGGDARFFLNDFIRDLSSISDPKIISETIKIYNVFGGLVRSNAEIYRIGLLRAEALLAKRDFVVDVATYLFSVGYLKRELVRFLDDADSLIVRLCTLTGIVQPDTGTVPEVGACWGVYED